MGLVRLGSQPTLRLPRSTRLLLALAVAEKTPLPISSPVPSANPLRIGSNGEQALDQRPKPRAPSEHLERALGSDAQV